MQELTIMQKQHEHKGIAFTIEVTMGYRAEKGDMFNYKVWHLIEAKVPALPKIDFKKEVLDIDLSTAIINTTHNIKANIELALNPIVKIKEIDERLLKMGYLIKT